MKKTVRLARLLLILLAVPLSGTIAEEKPNPTFEKRWVYMPRNLYVNSNVPKIEALMERAKAAGYNGILLTDYKMCTWWKLGDPARWKANSGEVRAKADELGLELTVCVFPFGYAGSLLWHDVNLASGMPIKDAPLVAKDGCLLPETTATLENGSFEQHSENKAKKFRFQDDIGKTSFIDSEVVKHGKVSLRFENIGTVNKHGNGRICQVIKVQPWQQYRLKAWLKTENLNAGGVKLLVMGKGRALQIQFLSAKKNGHLNSFESAYNLTTDWVEQSVTFNSLDCTEVSVYAGAWGGKTGRIWWDDLRIDDAPLMNLVRRDRLPFSIVGEDGTLYKEGTDFEPVTDPKLGMTSAWPGDFDTMHEPPRIKLTAESRIKDGMKVSLSCYHTALVYGGQVNCSMDDPEVFKICATQVRKADEALSPDGYFMSHDEIRTAGWEPAQTARFKSSGELFAYNIKTCFDIAVKEGGNKPVYVWSDMYDPGHNAHKNFYLVNNDIAGSWEGLDKSIVIMNWHAGSGAKFFSDRGHKQMIAAYYDHDVGRDRQMWIKAIDGVPNVIGIMYTTWRNDYSKLEDFAEQWWGGSREED